METKKQRLAREKAESQALKRQETASKLERQETERKVEQERKVKEEADREAERLRLVAQRELERLIIEAERKENERLANVALKLAPIQALYEELKGEILLELVKPLVENVVSKHIQSIKDGEVEVITDPTPEQRLDYTKPLQEYRVRKLKTALNNMR